MKFYILILTVIFSVNSLSLYAQADKVRSYVKLVAEGKITEAKWGYKKISKEFPNDPGVIFLGGVLEVNAADAVKEYKKVITGYPKSEWADDAYWRLIQYHVVMNELPLAKQELDEFKIKYPASEFLAPTMDLVRVAGVAVGEKSATEDKNETTGKKVLTDKKETSEKKVLTDKKETVGKKELYDKKVEFDKKEPELKQEPINKKETIVKKETETKKLDIKPQTKEEDTEKVTEVKWGLQIGIFSSNKIAQTEMNKYKKKRMEARVVSKVIDENTMYAVIIGSYKTKKDAEESRVYVNEVCRCSPLIVKF
jgi:cell division septation protein DedD